MTLLAVCQALAKNVGLQVPTSIVGNQDRQWVEALQFANEAGDEVARRFDWQVLRTATVLTGIGTSDPFALPDSFGRLRKSAAVLFGNKPLRAVSWPEIVTLAAVPAGDPRFFCLSGTELRIRPSLAVAAEVTVRYQSKRWVSAGAYTSDDVDALIPEDLITKCLIVRWRRQKGMPYADEEAEYEAAFADIAAFDSMDRP